jgi:hypothetical protein
MKATDQGDRSRSDDRRSDDHNLRWHLPAAPSKVRTLLQYWVSGMLVVTRERGSPGCAVPDQVSKSRRPFPVAPRALYVSRNRNAS